MKKTLRMIFLLSAMFCMTSVAMADDEAAEEDKVEQTIKDCAAAKDNLIKAKPDQKDWTEQVLNAL